MFDSLEVVRIEDLDDLITEKLRNHETKNKKNDKEDTKHLFWQDKT